MYFRVPVMFTVSCSVLAGERNNFDIHVTDIRQTFAKAAKFYMGTCVCSTSAKVIHCNASRLETREVSQYNETFGNIPARQNK